MSAKWAPCSVGRPIGANYDHYIAVRVFDPTLPVIRPALLAWRGIAVRRHDNFNSHFNGALNYSVKIFELEPQQNTIAVWSIVGVTDWLMTMVHFETVKL